MSVPAETARAAPRGGNGPRDRSSTSCSSSRSPIGFVLLGVLLVDVIRKGIGYLDPTLFTEPQLDRTRARPGAGPAIRGTIYMMVLLLVMVVPIGVGTALYLEEYANRDRWYNRLLEMNIQNLAAVPSIVYGILGLAFLVRGIGLGRVLLAGAAHPHPARPPDRDRGEPGGDPGRAGLDPPGRLRARRDPVAGDLAPGAPGRDPGDRHRARSSRSPARSARPRRSCSSARSRTSP